MKGLLIKDILNLKKTLSAVIVTLPFFIIITYASNNPSMIIGMVALQLTMLSISSMSYDELAKWDNYALAMPISRKKIVISKYILSLILSTIGVLVSIIIAYIIILLKGKVNITELLLTAYLVYLVSIYFICVLLPCIYKFGVEKSRLMMMMIIGIPFVIAYFIISVGISLPSENQFMTLLKLSPLIAIISVILSSNISYSIYRKKDL